MNKQTDCSSRGDDGSHDVTSVRHAGFKSVKNLQASDLPPGWRTPEALDVVRLVSQRVVMIYIPHMSSERPASIYSQCPHFGGTGFAYYVDQNVVKVRTNLHVIYNAEEAQTAIVQFSLLIPGKRNARIIRLRATPHHFYNNVPEDYTSFTCVTSARLCKYLHVFRDVPVLWDAGYFTQQSDTEQSVLVNEGTEKAGAHFNPIQSEVIRNFKMDRCCNKRKSLPAHEESSETKLNSSQFDLSDMKADEYDSHQSPRQSQFDVSNMYTAECRKEFEEMEYSDDDEDVSIQPYGSRGRRPTLDNGDYVAILSHPQGSEKCFSIGPAALYDPETLAQQRTNFMKMRTKSIDGGKQDQCAMHLINDRFKMCKNRIYETHSTFGCSGSPVLLFKRSLWCVRVPVVDYSQHSGTCFFRNGDRLGFATCFVPSLFSQSARSQDDLQQCYSVIRKQEQILRDRENVYRRRFMQQIQTAEATHIVNTDSPRTRPGYHYNIDRGTVVRKWIPTDRNTVTRVAVPTDSPVRCLFSTRHAHSPPESHVQHDSLQETSGTKSFITVTTTDVGVKQTILTDFQPSLDVNVSRTNSKEFENDNRTKCSTETVFPANSLKENFKESSYSHKHEAGRALYALEGVSSEGVSPESCRQICTIVQNYELDSEVITQTNRDDKKHSSVSSSQEELRGYSVNSFRVGQSSLLKEKQEELQANTCNELSTSHETPLCEKRCNTNTSRTSFGDNLINVGISGGDSVDTIELKRVLTMNKQENEKFDRQAGQTSSLQNDKSVLISEPAEEHHSHPCSRTDKNDTCPSQTSACTERTSLLNRLTVFHSLSTSSDDSVDRPSLYDYEQFEECQVSLHANAEDSSSESDDSLPESDIVQSCHSSSQDGDTDVVKKSNNKLQQTCSRFKTECGDQYSKIDVYSSSTTITPAHTDRSTSQVHIHTDRNTSQVHIHTFDHECFEHTSQNTDLKLLSENRHDQIKSCDSPPLSQFSSEDNSFHEVFSSLEEDSENGQSSDEQDEEHGCQDFFCERNEEKHGEEMLSNTFHDFHLKEYCSEGNISAGDKGLTEDMNICSIENVEQSPQTAFLLDQPHSPISSDTAVLCDLQQKTLHTESKHVTSVISKSEDSELSDHNDDNHSLESCNIFMPSEKTNKLGVRSDQTKYCIFSSSTPINDLCLDAEDRNFFMALEDERDSRPHNTNHGQTQLLTIHDQYEASQCSTGNSDPEGANHMPLPEAEHCLQEQTNSSEQCTQKEEQHCERMSKAISCDVVEASKIELKLNLTSTHSGNAQDKTNLGCTNNTNEGPNKLSTMTDIHKSESASEGWRLPKTLLSEETNEGSQPPSSPLPLLRPRSSYTLHDLKVLQHERQQKKGQLKTVPCTHNQDDAGVLKQYVVEGLQEMAERFSKFGSSNINTKIKTSKPTGLPDDRTYTNENRHQLQNRGTEKETSTENPVHGMYDVDCDPFFISLGNKHPSLPYIRKSCTDSGVDLTWSPHRPTHTPPQQNHVYKSGPCMELFANQLQFCETAELNPHAIWGPIGVQKCNGNNHDGIRQTGRPILKRSPRGDVLEGSLPFVQNDGHFVPRDNNIGQHMGPPRPSTNRWHETDSRAIHPFHTKRRTLLGKGIQLPCLNSKGNGFQSFKDNESVSRYYPHTFWSQNTSFWPGHSQFMQPHGYFREQLSDVGEVAASQGRWCGSNNPLFGAIGSRQDYSSQRPRLCRFLHEEHLDEASRHSTGGPTKRANIQVSSKTWLPIVDPIQNPYSDKTLRYHGNDRDNGVKNAWSLYPESWSSQMGHEKTTHGDAFYDRGKAHPPHLPNVKHASNRQGFDCNNLSEYSAVKPFFLNGCRQIAGNISQVNRVIPSDLVHYQHEAAMFDHSLQTSPQVQSTDNSSTLSSPGVSFYDASTVSETTEQCAQDTSCSRQHCSWDCCNRRRPHQLGYLNDYPRHKANSACSTNLNPGTATRDVTLSSALHSENKPGFCVPSLSKAFDRFLSMEEAEDYAPEAAGFVGNTDMVTGQMAPDQLYSTLDAKKPHDNTKFEEWANAKEMKDTTGIYPMFGIFQQHELQSNVLHDQDELTTSSSAAVCQKTSFERKGQLEGHLSQPEPSSPRNECFTVNEKKNLTNSSLRIGQSSVFVGENSSVDSLNAANKTHDQCPKPRVYDLSTVVRVVLEMGKHPDHDTHSSASVTQSDLQQCSQTFDSKPCTSRNNAHVPVESDADLNTAFVKNDLSVDSLIHPRVEESCPLALNKSLTCKSTQNVLIRKFSQNRCSQKRNAPQKSNGIPFVPSWDDNRHNCLPVSAMSPYMACSQLPCHTHKGYKEKMTHVSNDEPQQTTTALQCGPIVSSLPKCDIPHAGKTTGSTNSNHHTQNCMHHAQSLMPPKFGPLATAGNTFNYCHDHCDKQQLPYFDNGNNCCLRVPISWRLSPYGNHAEYRPSFYHYDHSRVYTQSLICEPSLQTPRLPSVSCVCKSHAECDLTHVHLHGFSHPDMYHNLGEEDRQSSSHETDWSCKDHDNDFVDNYPEFTNTVAREVACVATMDVMDTSFVTTIQELGIVQLFHSDSQHNASRKTHLPTDSLPQLETERCCSETTSKQRLYTKNKVGKTSKRYSKKRNPKSTKIPNVSNRDSQADRKEKRGERVMATSLSSGSSHQNPAHKGQTNSDSTSEMSDRDVCYVMVPVDIRVRLEKAAKWVMTQLFTCPNVHFLTPTDARTVSLQQNLNLTLQIMTLNG